MRRAKLKNKAYVLKVLSTILFGISALVRFLDQHLYIVHEMVSLYHDVNVD